MQGKSTKVSLEHPVERLRRMDRDYLSWGDTVHYQSRPIVAERCEKDLIFDAEGHTYIDSQMWHSSCNFGYRNPAIESAVMDQLHRLPQVSGDFLHQEKLELAEAVCEAIEARTGMKGRVSFNVSGTLVVEDALKIVRRHTGCSRVAAMMGGYHGRSLEVSGISSSRRYRQYYGEFPNRAIMYPFAHCAQCYYDKIPEDCATYCGKMIRRSLESDFYGICSDDSAGIGAVMLEMCQGRGYTIPPRDFYAQFVPHMRERGILIVADEIQVGMFRTGKLFAFEHFDLVPDIITMSKSLTNGLSPLSLMWARDALISPDVITPGHAHSNFANHSLGTAAALAAWRYVMAQDYERTLPPKSHRFLEGLKRIQRKHAFVHHVDGLGMLFNMSFADADGKPLHDAGKIAVTLAQDEDYLYEGRALRMVLNSGGYWNDALKFAPWLDLSEDDIDRTVAVLGMVIDRLAECVADRLNQPLGAIG